MDQKDIDKILLDLESGYDLISDKFSVTRSFFWRDLEFLKDYVMQGDQVLDFGCGNGRLLAFLKDKFISYKGVDVSEKLIRLAKERYPNEAGNFLKIGSDATLPFYDNSFNKIFSIAVFHHFPPEYAENVAKELYRVLSPGGKLVVTVWNLWQPRKIKYVLRSLISLNFKNVYISFKDGWGNIFYRYHRAYTRNELSKIFKKAGFRIEKADVINRKNLVLIARK